jgi:hypothetical protein
MTETKLRQVCDEAVEIQREIAALEKRADKIRLLIIAEATTSDAKKPTDGGGESIEFAASDSSLVRVTFPAPSLKSCINPETPAGAKILTKVGRWKDSLFTPVLKYALVENFRDKARECIGGVTAEAVIRSCETKSSPKVSYELREA